MPWEKNDSGLKKTSYKPLIISAISMGAIAGAAAIYLWAQSLHENMPQKSETPSYAQWVQNLDTTSGTLHRLPEFYREVTPKKNDLERLANALHEKLGSHPETGYNPDEKYVISPPKQIFRGVSIEGNPEIIPNFKEHTAILRDAANAYARFLGIRELEFNHVLFRGVNMGDRSIYKDGSPRAQMDLIQVGSIYDSLYANISDAQRNTIEFEDHTRLPLFNATYHSFEKSGEFRPMPHFYGIEQNNPASSLANPLVEITLEVLSSRQDLREIPPEEISEYLGKQEGFAWKLVEEFLMKSKGKYGFTKSNIQDVVPDSPYVKNAEKIVDKLGPQESIRAYFSNL